MPLLSEHQGLLGWMTKLISTPAKGSAAVELTGGQVGLPCDLSPFLIRRRTGFHELHQVKKLCSPPAEAKQSLSLHSPQGA